MAAAGTLPTTVISAPIQQATLFNDPPGTAQENTDRLNALLANGGHVKITTGDTYEINAPLVGTGSSIVFDIGAATLRCVAPFPERADMVTLGTTGVQNDGSGITASGGIFDGNFLGRRVRIIGHGLGKFVRGLIILNTAGGGGCIYTQASNDDAQRDSGVQITHNTLSNVHEGILVAGCDRYIIADNVINEVYAQDGIEPVNCRFGIITRNHIRNPAQQAIDLFANSGRSSNPEYLGNKFTKIFDNIIECDIPYALQSDVTRGITVSGQSGAVCERIEIYNNHVSGMFATGISTYGNPEMRNISIHGNWVKIGESGGTPSSGELLGIDVSGQNGVTCDGIFNNTVELIEDTVAATRFGIGNRNPHNQPFNIDHNRIIGCPDYSISLLISANMAGIKIRENDFFGGINTIHHIHLQHRYHAALTVTDNDFTGGLPTNGPPMRYSNTGAYRFISQNKGYTSEAVGSEMLNAGEQSKSGVLHMIGTASHGEDLPASPKVLHLDGMGNWGDGALYTNGLNPTGFNIWLGRPTINSIWIQWRASQHNPIGMT